MVCYVSPYAWIERRTYIFFKNKFLLKVICHNSKFVAVSSCIWFWPLRNNRRLSCLEGVKVEKGLKTELKSPSDPEIKRVNSISAVPVVTTHHS